MPKEIKYAGQVRGVRTYPSKKSVIEMPTVGHRYTREQAEKHIANIGEALKNGAKSIVITHHRRHGQETCLYA